MNRRDVEKRISEMFQRYTAASRRQARTLVPPAVTLGKLYEAYVLGLVAEALTAREHLVLTLVGGTSVVLKSAPGPINHAYPHIEARRNGEPFADIWTDIEFIALSCTLQGRSTRPTLGDYHELDILLVKPGTTGRPTPAEILAGVECKNTGYTKGLLKEILGIRRELSLLQATQPTQFVNWPRDRVPAEPPVCLLVYSTDPGVTRYAAPGSTFGIDFLYEGMS